MKNSVQPGKEMEYFNSSSENTIASGDVVVLPSGIGVACVDIAPEDYGNVSLGGVFNLAKVTGTAFAQGDRLFWDATQKKLTKTAAGNVPAGIAFKSAEAADTTASCKLSPAAYGQAANVAALGATSDLTAIGGVFADLAAARTAVNTLATEVEARLDAIEAKVDAVLAAFKAAGSMANS